MGLYSVLTVLLTWPLAANLTVMDPGDSAFFAWEIGWEVHALKTNPAELPHGNIFHPLRYTLGLDEPILGTTLVVLPLAVWSDDAVLLHNVARLLTFVFSGLTAFWLARELGAGEGAALLAGAAFAFSPIRTDQIAHLSTLGTHWLPLVVLYAVRFARTGRPAHALLSALFFVLTFHACGYHGVIALAVLPPAFVVLLWGQWRRLGTAVLAGALAGAALVPLYLMHRKALQPERYERGAHETTYYSAAIESFLATSSWNRLYGDATDPFRTIGPNNLFPGLVLPGLAVMGALRLWRRRERPSREAVALAVMALMAVVVALGPRLRLFGADLGPGPFALVREVAPVFKMIRVTSRAGVFLALPLAMLAAKALADWGPRRAVLGGLFVLALAEGVVAPIPMPEWTKVIDSRREPPAGLPLAPLAAGGDSRRPPADARRLRPGAAGRLPRERLHGLLDPPLDAPRERLRGHRARGVPSLPRARSVVPLRRVPVRDARHRCAVRRPASGRIRSQPVGAPRGGAARGPRAVDPGSGLLLGRHRVRDPSRRRSLDAAQRPHR